MRKISKLIFIFLLTTLTLFSATFEKELQYKSKIPKYNFKDSYTIDGIKRTFQWKKISTKVDEIEMFINEHQNFGVARNYKNVNGEARIVKEYKVSSTGLIVDKYGTSRSQAVPLYTEDDFETPYRYLKDGTLLSLGEKDESGLYIKVKPIDMKGEYWAPTRYIRRLSEPTFDRIMVIDRKNQNGTAIEKVGSVWKVRSMVPVTTGLNKAPYSLPTPLGIYVTQEKLLEMKYLKDGSKEDLEGFAPFATRFTRGGYLHGIPVEYDYKDETMKPPYIEDNWALGTYPRSHMCVRNLTSHAQWLFDWLPSFTSLVVVIE